MIFGHPDTVRRGVIAGTRQCLPCRRNKRFRREHSKGEDYFKNQIDDLRGSWRKEVDGQDVDFGKR